MSGYAYPGPYTIGSGGPPSNSQHRSLSGPPLRRGLGLGLHDSHSPLDHAAFAHASSEALPFGAGASSGLTDKTKYPGGPGDAAGCPGGGGSLGPSNSKQAYSVRLDYPPWPSEPIFPRDQGLSDMYAAAGSAAAADTAATRESLRNKLLRAAQRGAHRELDNEDGYHGRSAMAPISDQYRSRVYCHNLLSMTL